MHPKPKDFVRHKTVKSLFGQVLSVQTCPIDFPVGKESEFVEATVVLEDDGLEVSAPVEDWEVVSEA
jgi:hypothetical protein